MIVILTIILTIVFIIFSTNHSSRDVAIGLQNHPNVSQYIHNLGGLPIVVSNCVSNWNVIPCHSRPPWWMLLFVLNFTFPGCLWANCNYCKSLLGRRCPFSHFRASSSFRRSNFHFFSSRVLRTNYRPLLSHL